MIKNLEKINILKRDKVKRGLEFIDEQNKKEHIIDKVIIFGSSIRDDCTSDSDIDLCLVTDCDCHNAVYFNTRGKLADIMDDLCDIVSYDKLNDEFKKIIDKGVLVYEWG